MIDGLKPYQARKPSRVDWLGDLPAHWDVCSLGSRLTRRSQRNQPDLPLLSVLREKGVVPRSQLERAENHNLVPDDLSEYRVVRAGDLVINKMKAWQGSLGIAPCDGVVSPAYYVFAIRIDHLPYAHRLLRCAPYVGALARVSDGVRIGQWDLSISGMKRIPMLLPPLEEQTKICEFLSRADRKIDQYIFAKRRAIALIEELKSGVIESAVTGGVCSNGDCVPTGASFLEKLPSSWSLISLRRRWKVIDCKHLTVPYVDNGVPLASVREVQKFELDLSTARRTSLESALQLQQGGRKPILGDVIYCRNVSVGASAYVSTNVEFAMGQDVCLIRSSRHDGRYLNYFLHSPSMKRQLAQLLVGSTFNRINVEDIKALQIALPPPEEQEAIVEFLDCSLRKFDEPIQRARREIAALLEYRDRLSAEVLLGKLDVRSTQPAALGDIDAVLEHTLEEASQGRAFEEAI